jgi:hypothetical protein
LGRSLDIDRRFPGSDQFVEGHVRGTFGGSNRSATRTPRARAARTRDMGESTRSPRSALDHIDTENPVRSATSVSVRPFRRRHLRSRVVVFKRVSTTAS